jgi:hypothetical protein
MHIFDMLKLEIEKHARYALRRGGPDGGRVHKGRNRGIRLVLLR